MRILMLSSPVATHFSPAMPLARAAVAAGHEVLYVGQPDVARAPDLSGVPVVETGTWYNAGEIPKTALGPGVRPVQQMPRLDEDGMARWAAQTFGNHARYVTDDYVRIALDVRPDLVLCDPMELASGVVAGVLDIPQVAHRYGMDAMCGPIRTLAHPWMDGPCRRWGVAEYREPDLILDPFPPVLQAASAPLGEPIRFVPSHGGGIVPVELLAPRPPGARPLVVVSLGRVTLSLNGVGYVGRLLNATGTLDADVVATVNGSFREELGPVPDNVTLVEPTPLDLLCAQASVVVHHGGSGSALTASALGLPQLVLPNLADQFLVGDRLAESGAGLTLGTADEQDDPDVVRDALVRLLGESSFRTAAGELAATVRAMPAPSEIVPDLEKLAGVQ